MEPILVAAIAAVASIIGGLIGGALRPWGEDWVARRREAREADREHVGRMLTSPTPEGRESAKNDALRRVGELLRVPQRR